MKTTKNLFEKYLLHFHDNCLGFKISNKEYPLKMSDFTLILNPKVRCLT